MGLFSSFRNFFGKSEATIDIIDEDGEVLSPIDITMRRYDALAEVLQKGYEDQEEHNDAFEKADDEFSLQIQACENAISKGQGDKDEVTHTKGILEGKRTKLFNKFIIDSKKFEEGIEKASIDFVDAHDRFMNEATDLVVKASEEKKKKVKKVMDEWKEGKLDSSSGDKVTDQKQAIAIALSEAGLNKGGEGSKGGKVIGHTKSGKPIYDTIKEKLNNHYQELRREGKIHHDAIKSVSGGSVARKHEFDYHDVKDHIDDTRTGKEKEKENKVYSNRREKEIDYLSNQKDLSKADDYTNNYAAVIYKDKEGRVLLLQRSDGSKQFMLPGGHIESGEIPVQAAVREFKEETNIDLDPVKIWACNKEEVQGGKEIYYFSADQYANKGKDGVLANLDQQNEASDMKFMSTDEWLAADLFKDTKEHLKKILLPQPMKKAEENELEKGGIGSGRKLSHFTSQWHQDYKYGEPHKAATEIMQHQDELNKHHQIARQSAGSFSAPGLTHAFHVDLKNIHNNKFVINPTKHLEEYHKSTGKDNEYRGGRSAAKKLIEHVQDYHAKFRESAAKAGEFQEPGVRYAAGQDFHKGLGEE